MSKRKCLMTGNETNCTDGCYNCGCGGEVALNDFYVPIYDIQRVCDIVRNMEIYSAEVAAEYIRDELEKMMVEIRRTENGMVLDYTNYSRCVQCYRNDNSLMGQR